jgi:hypothetical protein
LSWEEDTHLDVLQNIESGLKILYEENTDLIDSKVIIGLENAKIAIKQHFGYSKNEKVRDEQYLQAVIQFCIEIGINRINKINDLTLKQYCSLIEKVKRSVKRHSEYGKRGYYEFIKNYV